MALSSQRLRLLDPMVKNLQKHEEYIEMMVVQGLVSTSQVIAASNKIVALYEHRIRDGLRSEELDEARKS